MKITAKAIDRPRVVIVATVLTMILAVFAAIGIAVQRNPSIDTAVILVAIPYPGSLPGEAEEQITRKIEKALEQLDGVDFISSSSLRGSSVTQVIFLDGIDSKRARDDVEHLINQVRGELPVAREIQPMIMDIDFDSAPIMLVTLTGPEGYDERALKQVAEDVQDEIETIQGVSNTQLFGGREREVHVDINPELMTQYGLTPSDVTGALQQAHAEMPGGRLNSRQFNPTINNAFQLRTIDDITDVVLRHDEAGLVRVGDVAKVSDTYRRVQSVGQMDGQNSATIIVNKEAGINALGAAQAIKARVAELAEEYPHIRFSCTRDVSAEIGIMFWVLGSSAVFGALLVLVILSWAMGIRISILVLLAIPFSTAVALIFLYIADIPVSSMVLFSYVPVLGMVVDGAIIVAENIYRHIERGEDAVEAAKIGIDEVGLPVIAADLTTIAAFLPMLLIPGIMGDFMGVMPKVVSVALLGSVLVDHFLIPVVASIWYKRQPIPKSALAPRDASEHTRPNRGRVAMFYDRLLQYALDHRWVVVTCCVLALIWSGAVFKHIGFVFFPPSDRGQFEISIELPLGYSIEQTVAATRVVTKPLLELRETGELLHFVTAVGSSGGLASRLESGPVNGPEFGKVMVELVPPTNRSRHEDEIIAELREKIRPWPGMKIRFEEIEEGPPGGADVEVRFSGKDLDQMARIVKRLEEVLPNVNGTAEIRTDHRDDNPEIVIEPRKDIVGLFDMTEAQTAAAVQMAILGDSRIELSLEDEDVTLRVQLSPEFQRHQGNIEDLMLTSPTGRRATIGELTRVRRQTGLYGISRYNRRRKVSLYCDVIRPTQPDDVFRVFREQLLPEAGFEPVVGNRMAFLGRPGSAAEGVRAVFTGENEERDKGFFDMLRSMIIGIVLIAAILVIQFNSFRQTVVVLAAVPLSFVGVAGGMWLTGHPFSLSSFIGLVALTGIVVNDAIVMVDFTNRARRRGSTVREALLEAGNNRLRPVILTTVTTIGGMLPLFMNWSGGAEFWQPLTGAVIFGLASATVLTLVVIPVSYSLAYNWADRPSHLAVRLLRLRRWGVNLVGSGVRR